MYATRFSGFCPFIALALLFAVPSDYAQQSLQLPLHVTPPHGISIGKDIPGIGAVDTSRSAMQAVIERYDSDRELLNRFYPVNFSRARSARMQSFYSDWIAQLDSIDFDRLTQQERIDYLLLKNHLDHQLRQSKLNAVSSAETKPLLPFADSIISLAERLQELQFIDPETAANILNVINDQIDSTQDALEQSMSNKEAITIVRKTVANRAADMAGDLREALKDWYNFYNAYDPMFTWWVSEQYKTADGKLKEYAKFLREKIAGVKPDDDETIIGDPIGREALLEDLRYEMIPYAPEELIDIANKEYGWCETEMKKASRELGYGDEWRKALEHVKTLHVDPGKQPQLIRDLAEEAIRFVDDHNLVTVPKLARDMWRMEMMSPERQLVNPFFTGGEVISVSYPAASMTLEQKMMSMRGNNVHFSRATVMHELIPGHHLQWFMNERYKPYRRLFSTPFYFEGNSLYWEFLFWDMGFPKTPEDRIGMLFWRMHRCARIIFSLNFHLGKMTPEQCIDFLVEKVGHERENAAGEVRRSVQGGYGPLYQCAYMIGALQQRALRKELVDTGKMTERQFHDTLLHEGPIPVALIRAGLLNLPLKRDYAPEWKFY